MRTEAIRSSEAKVIGPHSRVEVIESHGGEGDHHNRMEAMGPYGGN